jgi:hypothetical protein
MGQPWIDGCVIDANPVGVHIIDGAAALSNAMIHSNSSCGLKIASATGASNSAVNCTIHANGATGVQVSAAGGASVTFMLIELHRQQSRTGMAALAGGGSVTALTDNCDFWNNGTHLTGASFGNWTHFVDPLYVAAPDDLHLQPTSPLIDLGTAAGVPVTDVDGDVRPQNGLWDIGADEVAPPGPAEAAAGQAAAVERETRVAGLAAWSASKRCSSSSL